jgi:hypothetical protein
MEGSMKRYRYAPFRPAFALAAVALTVATWSLMVVAPAALSPEPSDATALAARDAATGAIEVTIIPTRIDVIGMRSESVAAKPTQESVRHTSFKG